VVIGSDFAKFKAIGTINGESNYKFQLWSRDGTGDEGLDTFRIKIWYEETAAKSLSTIMDQIKR
jgi:hypothetical protein